MRVVLDRRLALPVLLFTSLGGASARAASCYDENDLPTVSNLEDHRGQLKAYLGGALYDQQRELFPTAVLQEPSSWRPSGPSRCGQQACGFAPEVRERIEKCKARLPPITLGEKEARRLRPDHPPGLIPEQKIAACIEADGYLWFGISFREGRGVGGVGRYHLATRKLEVRRPALLRSYSSTQLAWDGARLWVGTESLGECIGSNLAEGLVRYDWKKDQARTFKGSEDEGPCGFVVHGLAYRTGAVWVATDLGLSRWDRVSDSWEHQVFARAGERLEARRTSCPAIYREVLPGLSTAPGSTAMFGSAKDQFTSALRAFRPGVATRLLGAAQ